MGTLKDEVSSSLHVGAPILGIRGAFSVGEDCVSPSDSADDPLRVQSEGPEFQIPLRHAAPVQRHFQNIVAGQI